MAATSKFPHDARCGTGAENDGSMRSATRTARVSDSASRPWYINTHASVETTAAHCHSSSPSAAAVMPRSAPSAARSVFPRCSRRQAASWKDWASTPAAAAPTAHCVSRASLINPGTVAVSGPKSPCQYWRHAAETPATRSGSGVGSPGSSGSRPGMPGSRDGERIASRIASTEPPSRSVPRRSRMPVSSVRSTSSAFANFINVVRREDLRVPCSSLRITSVDRPAFSASLSWVKRCSLRTRRRLLPNVLPSSMALHPPDGSMDLRLNRSARACLWNSPKQDADDALRRSQSGAWPPREARRPALGSVSGGHALNRNGDAFSRRSGGQLVEVRLHRGVVVGEVRLRGAVARGDQHVQVVLPARADLADLLLGVEVLYESQLCRTVVHGQQQLDPPVAVVVGGRQGQPPRRIAGVDVHVDPRRLVLVRHLHFDRAARHGVALPGPEPAGRTVGLGDAGPHVLDRRAERPGNDKIAADVIAEQLAGGEMLHAVSSFAWPVAPRARRSRRVRYTSVSSASRRCSQPGGWTNWASHAASSVNRSASSS